MVATVTLWWLLPRAARPTLLVAATALLLAYLDPRSLGILAGVTGLTFVAATGGASRHQPFLIGTVAAIVIALAAFKLMEALAPTAALGERVVPLGMSYYSLRCVHLLIEVYIGRVESPGLMSTLAYLCFPPTIIAGPIHRYPGFIVDATNRPSVAELSKGLERIVYGYVKIVVVGNYLFGLQLFPAITSGLVPGSGAYEYLDALQYGLTLYFQFSGYSDIEIGFSLLLGQRIIENFSWPLLRTNIVEFWRSWHISLTSLCREYVFASVFASTRKAWLGVVATMLAISSWHGLTLNYLLWGTYHAVGVVIFQRWTRSRAAALSRRALPGPVHAIVGWLITFQFVMLGFIWTKEQTFTDSFFAFKAIAMELL